RIIKVSDDIVSNSAENHRDRRGIAGDLPVFKIAGAAIEAGADLDEAERIAWKANDATRSFGVAFDGPTLPGAAEALFHVEADQPERAEGGYQGRAAVLVNGLGTVKYEELFVVYAKVAALLEEAGITPVRPEVGELVTSLDMAGLSLTLVFLDEELEEHWLAPVDTPAFHRGAMPQVDRPRRTSFWEAGADETPEATEESRAAAAQVAEVLELFRSVCAREEEELGRIDAIAGDGDHGQGMTYGSKGAATAAQEALEAGAGARTLLVRAGEAWSESAGGTSGALWGAALTAAGGVFDDRAGVESRTVVDAVEAGIDAIQRLGGAKVGDKTM